VIEAARLWKVDDAHRRGRERVSDQVDRGLATVAETHARQLVLDAVIHAANDPYERRRSVVHELLPRFFAAPG
jgi:hypothetical protein